MKEEHTKKEIYRLLISNYEICTTSIILSIINFLITTKEKRKILREYLITLNPPNPEIIKLIEEIDTPNVLHEVKIDSFYFEKILRGELNCYIGINDGHYRKGGIIMFKEWNPLTNKYMGRALNRSIIGVIDDVNLGLKEDYVLLLLDTK